MSELLERPPFGERDDARFLAEMVALTRAHREGCAPFAAMCAAQWPAVESAVTVADLPFVHVGLFKRLELVTEAPELERGRTLESSSTTGGTPSRVALDARSSELQARSSRAILADFVGEAPRPLLVLDAAASLRRRGGLGARVAAAMSLQPFASETHFLLAEATDATSLKWAELERVLAQHDELLVYGFTWVLWRAWARGAMPAGVRAALAGKRVHFVHSGGWKRLEAERVDRATLDGALLGPVGEGSAVVDYYGLVEQVGIVYPLCAAGARHVPVWAEVLVRDPHTLAVLEPPEEIGEGTGEEPGAVGALQLMNVLAHGAPYHNVLTEDLGRRLPGACPCGRGERRFELLGRIPRAEVRGCANV